MSDMPTCQNCKKLFQVSKEGMVSVTLRPFRPDHLPGFQSRPEYEYLWCKPCAMQISKELFDGHALDPAYTSYLHPMKPKTVAVDEYTSLLSCDKHGTARPWVVCTHVVDQGETVHSTKTSDEPDVGGEVLCKPCSDALDAFQREGSHGVPLNSADLRLCCGSCLSAWTWRSK